MILIQQICPLFSNFCFVDSGSKIISMLHGMRLPLLSVCILYIILKLFCLLLFISFVTITDLMLLKLKEVICKMSIQFLLVGSCSISCIVFHLMSGWVFPVCAALFRTTPEVVLVITSSTCFAKSSALPADVFIYNICIFGVFCLVFSVAAMSVFYNLLVLVVLSTFWWDLFILCPCINSIKTFVFSQLSSINI